MAVGLASVLAFVGIVIGVLGIFFVDVLALILGVTLFGIAVITLDAEMSEMRTRLNALGGAPRGGWAPPAPRAASILRGPSRCAHTAAGRLVRRRGWFPSGPNSEPVLEGQSHQRCEWLQGMP